MGLLGGGGTEDVEGYAMASLKSPKNLLPLSHPLPPPLSPGLWSPFPALLLLVYMLPLSSY